MNYSRFFLILLCNAHIAALNISIIIPCHFKHAKHLETLLHIYEQQSLLPNEILISISDSNKAQKIIRQISNHSWLFQVKIIQHIGSLTASENRNVECKYALGDIFILQDADDLPHPQRVEIIHYFFEKHQLDHLQHKWGANQAFKTINIEKIEPIYLERHVQCYGQNYVQGAPAISKDLFQKLKWDNQGCGEDTRFNGNAYQLTKKRLVIPVVLYHYRPKLSASKKKKSHLFYPIVINDLTTQR